MLHGVAFQTPLGTLVATASPEGLVSVGFDLDRLQDTDQEAPSPVLDHFGAWLDAYLSGRFDALPAVPLAPAGSPFDQATWEALRGVKPGWTITYGALAETVGRPGAARAVGGAVGRNPLLLLTPCHRVLGARRHLGGFSAGIERKAWLLRHEGVLLL